MRTITLLIATLALLTAGIPAHAGASAAPGEGNGIVMMIHGYDETRLKDLPWGPVGYPRMHEAVVAARDGDAFELAVIPYSVETARPVVLDAYLEVTLQDGTQVLAWPVEGFGRSLDVCELETSIAGHEGPLESCLVFRLPVEDVPPGSAVTFALRFLVVDFYDTEPYSAVSHVLLHHAIQGGHGSLEDADAHTEPTPFLLMDKLF